MLCGSVSLQIYLHFFLNGLHTNRRSQKHKHSFLKTDEHTPYLYDHIREIEFADHYNNQTT